MTSYTEYVTYMKSLTTPQNLHDHMPVMYAAMLGRPISTVGADSDEILVTFEGGGTLRIWDDAQSCCETRYMTTDDELHTFIGAKIVGIDVVNGPDVDDEYETHEQTFVKLETTAGTITLVTHNEHNGYYGGFDVSSEWRE